MQHAACVNYIEKDRFTVQRLTQDDSLSYTSIKCLKVTNDINKKVNWTEKRQCFFLDDALSCVHELEVVMWK